MTKLTNYIKLKDKHEAYVLYNGTTGPEDDSADYYSNNAKGVRIA